MSETLDFETQLHRVPIRNEKLKQSVSGQNGECLLVEVELRYNRALQVLANWVNARKTKRYELAGLSRDVFERVDGKTSVEQLIDWLCERELLTFLEGRALIVHYLKDLMRRGLIVIAGEK
jgi:hypothetical protein